MSAHSVLLNQEPSVVAVVPTLGTNIQRLNDSIRSNCRLPDVRIVVVNNSPLPEIDGMEDVDEVVCPGMNLGWVGSIELIRRTFRCDYLWTIQDDMQLLNAVGEILLQRLESEPDLAVASPVLVRDGVIPTGTRGGVMTDAAAVEWYHIPESDIPPEELGDRTDLCFISGSGALWRASALAEVGGFNLDLYPLMFVDFDMCLRLLREQWRIALVGQAHISHEIGGSTTTLLRQFAWQTNVEKVRRTFGHGYQSTEARSNGGPRDVESVVSRHATFLFIEFSKWANSRFENVERENVILRQREAELENEVASARAAFEQVTSSRSWKVTHFLRVILKQWKALRGRDTSV